MGFIVCFCVFFSLRFGRGRSGAVGFVGLWVLRSVRGFWVVGIVTSAAGFVSWRSVGV